MNLTIIKDSGTIEKEVTYFSYLWNHIKYWVESRDYIMPLKRSDTILKNWIDFLKIRSNSHKKVIAYIR